MDEARLQDIERKVSSGKVVMVDANTTAELCADIRDLLAEVRRLRERPEEMLVDKMRLAEIDDPRKMGAANYPKWDIHFHGPWLLRMNLSTGEREPGLKDECKCDPARILDDGFGHQWLRCADAECALEVVRPGKVRCQKCEGK